MLLIIKSKENINYLKYRIVIFIIGINAIIFSEITLKFIQDIFLKNILIILLPLILFILLYLFFIQKLKLKFNYKS